MKKPQLIEALTKDFYIENGTLYHLSEQKKGSSHASATTATAPKKRAVLTQIGPTTNPAPMKSGLSKGQQSWLDHLEDLADRYKDAKEDDEDTNPEYAVNIKAKKGKGITADLSTISSKMSGVKQAIFGQTDYTADIKKVLSKHGKQIVVGLKIVRNPVDANLVTALNVVSLGKFGENMDKNDMNTLFHLKLEIKLANGVTITTEKEAILKMYEGVVQKKDQQAKAVNKITPNISLQSFIDNARQRMGSKFFVYNAKTNNCQNYILNILQTNNCGDNSDYDFIKQDTNALFKGLSKTRQIAKKVTDFGAQIELIKQGGYLR